MVLEQVWVDPLVQLPQLGSEAGLTGRSCLLSPLAK